MEIIETKSHLDRISVYPQNVILKLKELRSLILETAKDLSIPIIEETLKWNEPSFVVKGGSTLRYDWKEKSPQHVNLYFKCTSKIIPSIKSYYGDKFEYENNRAIYFDLDNDIPIQETKKCISLALKYHSLKQLDNLGLGS
jgi:hypothetical protein